MWWLLRRRCSRRVLLLHCSDVIDVGELELVLVSDDLEGQPPV